MNRALSSIEITFENMDYVDIPISFFDRVDFKNIETSLSLTGNRLEEKKLAHFVWICIKKKADKYLDSFNADICYDSLEKRLSLCDITSFRLHYCTGEYEDIGGRWEECEDNEYRNKLQRVTDDNEFDQLEIVIGREENHD